MRGHFLSLTCNLPRALDRVVVARTVAILLVFSVSAGVEAVPKGDGTVACSTEVKSRHNPKLIDDDAGIHCFQAYVSKFAPWPTLESGDSRPWGIPQWTVHRVDRRPVDAAPEKSHERPRSWLTLPERRKDGTMPLDRDYRFSSAFRKQHPDWYDRGHLTQKYLAERLGPDAGWFTHNLANAVPQRSRFNDGAWLALECFTGAWANESGTVWIVTGPVFVNGEPTAWLESDANRVVFPVAIPDLLFKVVARKRDDKWEAMGFLYPQDDEAYRDRKFVPPEKRLVSIARIETLTGLKFADDLHPLGRTKAAKGRLWEVSRNSFDKSCAKVAKEVK